ncbi:MAG: putative sulfate exporter family transporter [Litorimonas sp.]
MVYEPIDASRAAGRPVLIPWSRDSAPRLRALLPGMSVALAVTLCAYGLSALTGGPVMLCAVVLGLVLSPVLHGPATAPGLQVCAKTVLGIGVALLGVKIALADMAGLGWETVALVLACVSGTILSGLAVGRALGLRSDQAVLSSGAVAICGASAAMALCAAVPQDKDGKTDDRERHTLLSVMGVTLLGTVAMIAYPAVAHLLDLSDTQAGLFIGATIHNVAQVVGAGFMLSDATGETATVVKLMRVACLVPVIALVTLAYRRKEASRDPDCGGARPALVPGFLVGFVALVAINSLGVIPAGVSAGLSQLSGHALVIAIAALGLKTSLRDLVGVGGPACLILLVQTAALALFALFAVMLVPAFA